MSFLPGHRDFMAFRPQRFGLAPLSIETRTLETKPKCTIDMTKKRIMSMVQVLVLGLLLAVVPAGCSKPCTETDPRCTLGPDPGDCAAAFLRYYYDSGSGSCKTFTWGGCGDPQPFATEEECLRCKCRS